MSRKTKIALIVATAGMVGLAGVVAVHGASAHDRGDYRGDRGTYGHHERGGPGGEFHRGRMMMRFLEAYDTNSDDKLTQAEIDEARAARLTQFDASKDGVLSLEEYQALWLDAMRERMVDQFQEHDADGDGKVTTEEFGKRFAKLVNRFDRNGDGALDENDRRRPDDDGFHRGMMGQGMGGHPPMMPGAEEPEGGSGGSQ